MSSPLLMGSPQVELGYFPKKWMMGRSTRSPIAATTATDSAAATQPTNTRATGWADAGNRSMRGPVSRSLRLTRVEGYLPRKRTNAPVGPTVKTWPTATSRHDPRGAQRASEATAVSPVPHQNQLRLNSQEASSFIRFAHEDWACSSGYRATDQGGLGGRLVPFGLTRRRHRASGISRPLSSVNWFDRCKPGSTRRESNP